MAWSRQTFWFKLNFLLPKNESVLNILGNFLEQFQYLYNCSRIYPKLFSTYVIFSQQENLVDNQKCQAGFRPLCNKIPFRTSRRSSRTKNIHSVQSIQAKTLWFWYARFSFWAHWRHMHVWRGIYWDVVYQQRSLNTWWISLETAILMLLWHVLRRTLQLYILWHVLWRTLQLCILSKP